jgi:adenylate cyclase
MPIASTGTIWRPTVPARILVVDDEADVEPLLSQGFRRRIRSGELSLTFEPDGQAALDRLTVDPAFEIVLTDINMPRMDGLTLLGHLQSFIDLRAVIMSAYGDMNNIRTAMNRGAFDFITKPIDFADLERTLDKTLADLAVLREVRQQRDAALRARTNLSRYFSPNLVELLSQSDEPMAPVRQDVVALFADLVGFSTLSEDLEPEAVMGLLRGFHHRMAAEVFAAGGTLEKYVGDAMMAVFGVPTGDAGDAGRALRCAFAMLTALDAWNGERQLAGEPLLAMGIGLHHGPAVLGDIGNERAMAFAVVGDTVNSASRLQNLTRDLRCRLVVSRQLVQAVENSGDAEAQRLMASLIDHGERALRGRTRAISIFADGARE